MTNLDHLAYTRQQAAEMCNVSLDTIRRAIAAGKLRAKRIGQRDVRVTRDALQEWLEGLEDA